MQLLSGIGRCRGAHLSGTATAAAAGDGAGTAATTTADGSTAVGRRVVSNWPTDAITGHAVAAATDTAVAARRTVRAGAVRTAATAATVQLRVVAEGDRRRAHARTAGTAGSHSGRTIELTTETGTTGAAAAAARKRLRQERGAVSRCLAERRTAAAITDCRRGCTGVAAEARARTVTASHAGGTARGNTRRFRFIADLHPRRLAVLALGTAETEVVMNLCTADGQVDGALHHLTAATAATGLAVGTKGSTAATAADQQDVQRLHAALRGERTLLTGGRVERYLTEVLVRTHITGVADGAVVAALIGRVRAAVALGLVRSIERSA